ncbi:MAG: hypothetical protein HY315_01245 [Acidobacteria bacterium]|nr:hypothetical protein [Acidobacteriota bacterium]
MRENSHMGQGSARLIRGSFAAVLAAAGFCLCGMAAGPEKPSPDEIIKRFAAKESEFRLALQSYTYRTRMVIQVLDDRGTVKQERTLLIETYFTNDGKRQQRTLLDEGELIDVTMTEEDLDDAANIQPFALAAEDLPHYKIDYVGKEKADELDTYVFSVKPRRIEKGKRYFEGKIWVDDVDLQIVKTDGRAVPQTRDNKSPRFETIRQMIDKKYWFPVWTMGDEKLKFEGRDRPRMGTGLPFPLPLPIPAPRRRGSPGYVNEVRIREIITYEDYKKYEVKADIKFDAPAPESAP